ncbi:MobA/MobL family protein [Roseomonas aeriglobus]|nr:MobA/MobL family protein [Roseomonas aeriglobus]
MNSPSSNSGGSAGPVLPPPPHEFFVVRPDGSCTPATAKTLGEVLKQHRTEARKQARIKRHEKAVEIQMANEDRAAARRLLQELAETERDAIRWAARLRVRVKPEPPKSRTSSVLKRVTITPTRIKGPSSLRAASSWVTDDYGRRGVIWQQSYLGRKSPNFYRGAARDNWEYEVRDEAVLLDAAGEPVIISNMGEDWVEIGAAWQALEDASTRKNAKIQIRAIAPFDADASEEETIAALRHFSKTVLEPLNLPYSAVIHRAPDGGDERNRHPHISFSLRPMRRVEAYCWEVADEVRGELDGRDGVQMLRHLWAHAMSEAAEQARSNRRYTGLGYGARGLPFEAGEHLGEARSAMARRGELVWAHERNRIKSARNAARRAIRDADRKIAALTKVRDAAVASMSARSEGSMRTRIVSSAQPHISSARLKNSSRRQANVEMLTVSSVSAKTPPLVASTVGSEREPDRRVPLVASQKPRVGPMPMKLAADVERFQRMPRRSICSLQNEAVQPLVTSRQPEPPARLIQSKPAAAPAELKVARAIGERSPPLLASRVDAGLVPTLSVRAKVAGKLKPPLVPSSRALHTDLNIAAKIDELLHALSAARVERDNMRVMVQDRAIAADRSIAQQSENSPSASMERAPVPPARPRSSPPVGAVSIGSQRRRFSRSWASDDRHIIPTRAELETRYWLEAHPRMPSKANGTRPLDAADRLQLDRIHTRDVYVADYGGEAALTIDGAKAHAMGISDEWLARPEIQQSLGDIRAEQQKVVTALLSEVDLRPLDFARHGIRAWPRDLDPDQLKRLDRWAADDGFQRDTFGIEQRIQAAHNERERRAREATARNITPAKPAAAIPDGFGGWNSTPAPPFTGEHPTVRMIAFDRKTGKPTNQLLMLLDLAATHPRRIVFATDGKLTATQGAPALMLPLLHGWRHDQRVADLVVATVRASREAGQPAWPPEMLPEMRAYHARSSQHPGRALIDWSSGPSR